MAVVKRIVPKANKVNKKIIKDVAALAPKRRSGRVNRILKKKEPQLIENTKKVLVLKGVSSSQIITDVLKDIAQLCKPNCKVLSRNNEIMPFEDTTSLEFLESKNDCSLFLLGSHSKKRPNNLVFVRFRVFIDGIILFCC